MVKQSLPRILYLEDNPDDVELVELFLEREFGRGCCQAVRNQSEFQRALDSGVFDVILSDNFLPGFSGFDALALARQQAPQSEFIFFSGSSEPPEALVRSGQVRAKWVSKDDLDDLVRMLNSLLKPAAPQEGEPATEATAAPIADAWAAECPPGATVPLDRQTRYIQSMELLVSAVQELSLARDLDRIAAIVRRTARQLNGADGATFVLRDRGCCYYLDEDAIAPLWKGQRFSEEICVGGLAMRTQAPVVIPDVYQDDRVPIEAYRATFIKSLVMVPVRSADPIGAIGNYWAHAYTPGADEIRLIQALADATAVALANVDLYATLEQRVSDRTAELAAVNHELEAFSYSVSHDLRAPLRAIKGFARALDDSSGDRLDFTSRHYLKRIGQSISRMDGLIEDLLQLAQVSRSPLERVTVDLSAIALEILEGLQQAEPERQVEVQIAPGLRVEGDAGLLRNVLENLLGNAWKYSQRRALATIELGCQPVPPGSSDLDRPPAPVFYVRDNGAGFDMAIADKLFSPFQRLHSAEDFPGTGIGLATVQRILARHGGRTWAEAAPDRGACFYFSLPNGVPAIV